ncbi:YbjN domain-containing protein [Sphingopyxis sp. QXT-31]|uniref:YbjN domain-containing protein n=1 Tax=Sphingopyxis sp. QXT-31 TaxID=1357916 RepID=UPI0009792694|nr:YbjN domain-containing protein [Sphingopyxis sp. QXT-31]APZ97918.1 YbjN domain-containing protein [Sphingopyxis sp. QXT-31]
MRKIAGIWAAGLALALTSPASAELIDAKSPKVIATLIESQGWKTAIDARPGESPVLKATRNGELFVIDFMNCTDGKNCKTLQFLMGFADAKEVTLDKLNEWNRDRRFARAYRDGEGDPVLAMDVDLDFSGLPRENVGELVNTWTGLMDSFRTFVRG